MAVLADVTKRTIREASDKTCNIGAMTKNQVTKNAKEKYCVFACAAHMCLLFKARYVVCGETVLRARLSDFPTGMSHSTLS